MAVYATADDLAAYIVDNDEVKRPTGDAAERLLERAQRDVDAVVGPWPRFSNGLKFDPTQLDVVQADALNRATCAAAEFRLQLGEATLVGDDDYLPGDVAVLRRAAAVSPKLLAELAGSGLLKRTGTAGLSPDPVPSPYLPWPPYYVPELP